MSKSFKEWWRHEKTIDSRYLEVAKRGWHARDEEVKKLVDACRYFNHLGRDIPTKHGEVVALNWDHVDTLAAYPVKGGSDD